MRQDKSSVGDYSKLVAINKSLLEEVRELKEELKWCNEELRYYQAKEAES